MDDNNRLVREQFGAHANDYATSPVHAQGASLARLVELTKPQRDWTVLDVSTGAGHTALTFAPLVEQVTAAVDPRTNGGRGGRGAGGTVGSLRAARRSGSVDRPCPRFFPGN